MHGPNSKVQKNSEEGALRNPAYGNSEAQSHKHQTCLTKSTPSLLFDVCRHFSSDSMLLHKLSRCKCSSVQRGLGDESRTWGQTKNAARNDSDPQTEEVPVESRGLLQIVLGCLSQNARDIVVDEKEQIKHECREECAEDSLGRNVFHRIDDPRTVHRWLPIPRGTDVHALDAVQVDTR